MKIIPLYLFMMFFVSNALAQTEYARVGDKSFTHTDFRKSIRYVEFIIGEKLQEYEKKQLLAETIRQFKQNPDAVLGEIQNIDHQMQQLYRITDVARIARLRSALIAQIYIMTYGQSPEPYILKVMKRHIPLLAIDQQNLLAFTQKDFDGYIKMLKLYARLSGIKLQLTQAQINRFRTQLVQQFPYMTIEQKTNLCSMQLTADYTYKVYAKMSPQQRQQLQAAYRNAYQNTATANGSDTQNLSEMRRRQRQYNGNQAAMNIYYNTMMSNHATMLNVFSSYDSNTYWEYKY